MKHQVLACILAVIFVFSLSTPALATSTVSEVQSQLDESRTARVYEEILSGEITSHADVIQVALDQYNSHASTLSINQSDDSWCDSLQIVQELHSEVHTDGTADRELALTNLLIVDGEGSQVAAASASDYVGYISNNGSLNEYSVYATHTMYVNIHFNHPENILSPETSIQLNRITTTLTYGTSVGAGKLVQSYSIYLGAYDSKNKDLSKTHTSPNAGSYNYYPDSSWYPVPNTNGSYMKSTAAVYVGSKVLVITCQENLDSASFTNIRPLT